MANRYTWGQRKWSQHGEFGKFYYQAIERWAKEKAKKVALEAEARDLGQWIRRTRAQGVAVDLRKYNPRIDEVVRAARSAERKKPRKSPYNFRTPRRGPRHVEPGESVIVLSAPSPDVEMVVPPKPKRVGDAFIVNPRGNKLQRRK